MTTTKTKTTKRRTPTADEVKQQAADKAQADRQVARVLTDGSCNGLVVQQYLPNINGGGDPSALAAVAADQVKSIASGNLTQLETMLLTQATALQSMFVDLALRAKRQNTFDGIQTITALALKCATGSRQAITALVELRTPKTVMFAKQANVTTGPQQVNNGAAAALPEAGAAVKRLAEPTTANVIGVTGRTHAGEIQRQQNELLEAQHGERLDA